VQPKLTVGSVDDHYEHEAGRDVAVNPNVFAVTIQTRYHDNPNDPSGYGKGTQEYDKEEKTTTLRAH